MADIPPYPTGNESFDYARSPVEIGLSSAVSSLRNSYLQRAEYEKSRASMEAKAKLERATQNREDQYLQIAKDQLKETKREHDLRAAEAEAKRQVPSELIDNPFYFGGHGSGVAKVPREQLKFHQNIWDQGQAKIRAFLTSGQATGRQLEIFKMSHHIETLPTGEQGWVSNEGSLETETTGTDILGQPTTRRTRKRMPGQGLPGGPSFLTTQPQGILGGPSFPSPSSGGGIQGSPAPAVPNVVDDIINKWH